MTFTPGSLHPARAKRATQIKLEAFTSLPGVILVLHEHTHTLKLSLKSLPVRSLLSIPLVELLAVLVPLSLLFSIPQDLFTSPLNSTHCAAVNN